MAGTITPGTFTLHDQGYTKTAVQAEQQDELRCKLGSTGLDNKRADGGSPLQVVTLSQGWSNMVLQLGRRGASAVQCDLMKSTADPQLHTQQLLQGTETLANTTEGAVMSFASAGTCSRSWSQGEAGLLLTGSDACSHTPEQRLLHAPELTTASRGAPQRTSSP